MLVVLVINLTNCKLNIYTKIIKVINLTMWKNLCKLVN